MSDNRKAGDVLTVGANVWVFDPNRRVYGPDSRAPIWREHWVKERVIGETRVSWLITPEWRGRKIPKREPLPWAILASEEEIEHRAWIEANAHKLADEVRRCRDYDTLQAVAKLFPDSR